MNATSFCSMTLTPHPDSFGLYHMSVMSLVDVDASATPVQTPNAAKSAAAISFFMSWSPLVRGTRRRAAAVGDEAVCKAGRQIDRPGFAVGFLPFLRHDGGKPSIALEVAVDLGQVNRVGDVQCLAVELAAADAEHGPGHRNVRECFGERTHDERAVGGECAATAHDEVLAFG